MLRKSRFSTAASAAVVGMVAFSWAAPSAAADLVVVNQTDATIFVDATFQTGEVPPNWSARFYDWTLETPVAQLSFDAYRVRPRLKPIHKSFQSTGQGPYTVVITAADFGKSVMFDGPWEEPRWTFVGKWSVGWGGSTSGSTIMTLESETADCGSYNHKGGFMHTCSRGGDTLVGDWIQDDGARGGFRITLTGPDTWQGTWNDPGHKAEGEWRGSRISD